MYVIPSKHIVAVRMRRAIQADYTSTTETNAFPAFFFDVYQLVP